MNKSFLCISFLFVCIYIYIFNNIIHSIYSYVDLSKCLKYNITDKYNMEYVKYKYGKDLWKYLLKSKRERICYFFRKMNIFLYNNSMYYHRMYSMQNDKKINLHVVGNFPDISYLRLVPKNKINFRNVLSHTYDIQHYIFYYQHPNSCSNKKFLIIKGYNSGHGSEIHALSSYLSLAFMLNRIAILDPFYYSSKAEGEYCSSEKNWLCFLEQLTNCSLPLAAYYNAHKYSSNVQSEKYVFVDNYLVFNYTIPKKIIDIVSNSSINENHLFHYWTIQTVTYLFRLNKKTELHTNEMIKKSLGNKLYKGCFNIWIRHGDKYKEMTLLRAEDYIPSYEIYCLMKRGKKPIYLSTDDPNVTSFFDKTKSYTSFYLKFVRKNDNFAGNMKRGAEMTLNFIADIKASLYCDGFSGTRKSNVVRLIDELRSTVGLSANSFYFENGIINISYSSYEFY